MEDFFISYSRQDWGYAHKLADTLKANKFSVWIDDRNIDCGAPFIKEIEDHLDGCRAFIVIMTPRSKESRWVQRELIRASRKGKPIFPLLLEGEEPWLLLEDLQLLDVRRGQLPPSNIFHGLLAKIETPAKVPSPLPAESPFAKELENVEELIKNEEMPLNNVLDVLRAVLPHPTPPTPWEKMKAEQAKAKVFEWPKPEAARESVAPTVPRLYQQPESEPSPSKLPQILTPQYPFEPELILIPAGEFLMGSDPQKDKQAQSYENELPQHKLYLRDYYIARTPVTNAQYATFVQTTGHGPPEQWNRKGPRPGEENHPVVNVSWEDAVAYCKWLTQVTGRA
jgi:hypothetical protein